ncbi:allatostatin-A receptor [Anabrus simplex]|uniref:allatostatin-A receptor n=1 Tax=Anabrus simplex TaxID=316456 RepID=UPI0035A3C054
MVSLLANESIKTGNYELCKKLSLPESVMCIVDPDEMIKPWISNPMFIDIMVTHSVAFLCGLLGNGIVVFVMVGDRKARNATNLFLVSLALADLLLLLLYTPLEILHYFVLQWDEEGTVCKLAKYAELLSAVVSVLNLAAVTLERFLVIVFPMKSRSYCTLSNCRRAILVVWFVSLLITAPVLYTNDTYPITYTNLERNVTLHYCDDKVDTLFIPLYEFTVLLAVPGTLMIVCYTFVIRELWRSTRNMRLLTNSISMKNLKNPNSSRRRSLPSCHQEECIQEDSHCSNGQMGSQKAARAHHRGDEVRRARQQVIKMLIIVIVLFLVCWGPRIIMEILITKGMMPFTSTVYRLRVTFYVLPVVHACVNPFIYSFMSKNFRRSFQRQLERLGCKTCAAMGSVSGLHGAGSSRLLRETITSQKIYRPGLRHPGRGSTSSSTNCNTDLTRHTEVDNILTAADV